jgi:hypothetical protein
VRALAVLVLAPAFALGAVAGAAGIVGGNTNVQERPRSLVWADRVFVTRNDLAIWLESRGASYEAWAARHASSAQLFGEPTGRPGSSVSVSAASGREAASDHSERLLAGLGAGIALAGLLALFALRDRISASTRTHAPRRPALAGAQPRLIASVGHLSASIRRQGRSTVSSSSRRLRSLSTARRQAHLLADLWDPLVWHRARDFLPRITFYVISAICALVLGASVAIFLR